MSAVDRLARADTLFDLLTHLVGGDFGGHPACTDVDPELFFPEPGEYAKAAEAKAVCAGCEIKAACLAYAVRHVEPHGIWGGVSEDDRRMSRQKRPSRAA